MKTCNNSKLIGLALTGLSLFGSQAVYAAAGDSIANRATLNYSVGGATQTEIESSAAGNSTPGNGAGADTTFLEDRVINFTVARGASYGAAVPGGTQQVIEYTVTNNGNGSQGFLLKGLNNADGTADPWGGNNDDWDATSVQTFVEDGTNPGVYNPLEDTEAFIGTLTSGSSVTVYVVSTIPLVDSSLNPLVSDDVAVMTLVAQVAIPGATGIAADAIVSDDNANNSPGGTGFTNGTANVTAGVAAVPNPDGTGTEETVFNDPAGTLDGTGAAGATQNGQDSDDSSYRIESAELTVTKDSQVIWDFINLASSPKAIPGGGAGGGTIIRYTITVDNAVGAADATLDNIEDVLPLTLDGQFGDGTNANAAVNGTDNVRITDGAGAIAFCEADNGDGDGDGCRDDGGAGSNALVVDLTAVAGITNTLQAGETLTIEFDVELP